MEKKSLLVRLFNSVRSSRDEHDKKVVCRVPVFRKKASRKVSTPAEVKKRRIYANVPLGME